MLDKDSHRFVGILSGYDVGRKTACLSFVNIPHPATIAHAIQLLIVYEASVWDDPPLSYSFTVIVSTEITDGQGSKVQPCSVEVTVLPRYHGNDCPDKDL